MSDELCYMSATEAVTRFEQKSLSPVELTEAVIASSINPFADTYFGEAMERARATASVSRHAIPPAADTVDPGQDASVKRRLTAAPFPRHTTESEEGGEEVYGIAR